MHTPIINANNAAQTRDGTTGTTTAATTTTTTVRQQAITTESTAAGQQWDNLYHIIRPLYAPERAQGAGRGKFHHVRSHSRKFLSLFRYGGNNFSQHATHTHRRKSRNLTGTSNGTIHRGKANRIFYRSFSLPPRYLSFPFFLSLTT